MALKSLQKLLTARASASISSSSRSDIRLSVAGLNRPIAKFLGLSFFFSCLRLSSFSNFFGFGLSSRFGSGLKLVYPALNVDNPFLASEVGMGAGRDMLLEKWIFHTIKNDGFFSLDG